MSSGVTDDSSPTVASPTTKKKGLRRRLLRLFSRSESNLKIGGKSPTLELTSPIKGSKTPTGEARSPIKGLGFLDRKGRSSWSEKRGKKDRNEAQEIWQEGTPDVAQTLPHLRSPRSEDPVIRRTTRSTKTRSLSYSDIDLPATGFLHRFGSLTWRKKRSSVVENNDISSPESPSVDSCWSIGRLDRPAIGNEIDVGDGRPKSCLVESHLSLNNNQGFDYISKESQGGQVKLEVSTSFDCLSEDTNSLHTKGNSLELTNNQLQLPLASQETEKGEEEERSLPQWAENLLKEYMSPGHQPLDSFHYPGSGRPHSLGILEEDEEPPSYRSPLYPRIITQDGVQENTSNNNSHQSILLCSQDDRALSNIVLSDAQSQYLDHQDTGKCEVQKEKTQHQKHLFSISLTQNEEQKGVHQKHKPIHTHEVSEKKEQKNATGSRSTMNASPLAQKMFQNDMSQYKSIEHPQMATQEGLQNEPSLLQHQLYSSILGQEILSKELETPSVSPQGTPKIRYQVIITMTKEESQVPVQGGDRVREEELVGQETELSPSLESQACGLHGADPVEVTAESHPGARQYTLEDTAQEEAEITTTEKRGGETHKGASFGRSLHCAAFEEFYHRYPISGSKLITERCRPYSFMMEKDSNLLRERNPRSDQSPSVVELRNAFQLSSVRTRRERESSTVQVRMMSPQPYVGHVQGLRKVFEDIGHREVIQNWDKHKSKKFGSLREKKHPVTQAVLNTPGVHGPIYSQIFSPRRTRSLERKVEHATITVREKSPKLSTVIESNNGDTKEKYTEIKKAAGQDNIEFQSLGRSRRVKDTNQRQTRPPLQDLELPPRVPTPPLERTKDNVSITLGSPKGWRKYEERPVVQSPKAFHVKSKVGVIDTVAPLTSEDSNIFFFASAKNSSINDLLDIKSKNRQEDCHRLTDTGISREQNSTAKYTKETKEQLESFSKRINVAKENTLISAEVTEKTLSQGPVESEKGFASLLLHEKVDAKQIKGRKCKTKDKPFSESFLEHNENEDSNKVIIIVRSATQETPAEESMALAQNKIQYSKDIASINSQKEVNQFPTETLACRLVMRGLQENDVRRILTKFTTDFEKDKIMEGRGQIFDPLEENRTMRVEESPTEILVRNGNLPTSDAVLQEMIYHPFSTITNKTDEECSDSTESRLKNDSTNKDLMESSELSTNKTGPQLGLEIAEQKEDIYDRYNESSPIDNLIPQTNLNRSYADQDIQLIRETQIPQSTPEKNGLDFSKSSQVIHRIHIVNIISESQEEGEEEGAIDVMDLNTDFIIQTTEVMSLVGDMVDNAGYGILTVPIGKSKIEQPPKYEIDQVEDKIIDQVRDMIDKAGNVTNPIRDMENVTQEKLFIAPTESVRNIHMQPNENLFDQAHNTTIVLCNDANSSVVDVLDLPGRGIISTESSEEVNINSYEYVTGEIKCAPDQDKTVIDQALEAGQDSSCKTISDLTVDQNRDAVDVIAAIKQRSAQNNSDQKSEYILDQNTDLMIQSGDMNITLLAKQHPAENKLDQSTGDVTNQATDAVDQGRDLTYQSTDVMEQDADKKNKVGDILGPARDVFQDANIIVKAEVEKNQAPADVIDQAGDVLRQTEPEVDSIVDEINHVTDVIDQAGDAFRKTAPIVDNIVDERNHVVDVIDQAENVLKHTADINKVEYERNQVVDKIYKAGVGLQIADTDKIEDETNQAANKVNQVRDVKIQPSASTDQAVDMGIQVVEAVKQTGEVKNQAAYVFNQVGSVMSQSVINQTGDLIIHIQTTEENQLVDKVLQENVEPNIGLYSQINVSDLQEKAGERNLEIATFVVYNSQAGDSKRSVVRDINLPISEDPHSKTVKHSFEIDTGAQLKEYLNTELFSTDYPVGEAGSEKQYEETSWITDSEIKTNHTDQQYITDLCDVNLPHPVQVPRDSYVDQGYPSNRETDERVVDLQVEEERESPEDMNVWVNTLRQLETPEIMKHHRAPRQPRSSQLCMYATLPPIKEDIDSPKNDHTDAPSGLQKENYDLEVSALQIKDHVEAKTEENKVDQLEKKFSWEKNMDKLPDKTSPMEMMRKHSGEESSRSAAYKALITQNLSQRQGSIIGSLLLSDRLDKTTEKSEGKTFSRLDSSLLLSSYMRPKKEQLSGTVEEVQTPSQDEQAKTVDDTSIAMDNSFVILSDQQYQDTRVHLNQQSANEVNITSAQTPSDLPTRTEKQVESQFKAFPDVWHHPGKHHGKVNPRPGKIILFSEPGFKGHHYETSSDLSNTTDWELQESIFVRVIRGGWLLYEKPQFRGRRVMLSEGDIELPCPWANQKKTDIDTNKEPRNPKFWIGSVRHVVKDFQVPEISLFPEENGNGNKFKFVGAMPDIRVHGQPVKTVSIIVHSGMWLVYSQPFFEGDPYILERGGYPNMKAWGSQDPNVCSLQPALIGGPTVEKPNEPKLFLFQLPDFQGTSWEVTRDLHSIQGEPNSQGERLTSVGSLRVQGGCWVGYEKEGFRGHQYLLEEGDYRGWSQWGGCTEDLGSLRLIRTDFSEPEIMLYETPGCSEGPCLHLTESLTDVELAQYRANTGSIDVLSGVWVAYKNVDFSGEQYILEKGTYHNYQDWGADNVQICSLQPVLQVGGLNLHFGSKIQLFSEPNFRGNCLTAEGDSLPLPESFSPQSCRVEGGSWCLYEGEDCSGEQYILSEGDYPTRTAMGCLTSCFLRSVRKVPLYFSIPSISLHGLERFEGKELEFNGEVRSLQGEGYNNHVLSVKVGAGIWVLYEHSDFRGRQWLLERTQIPNWLLYSGHQRIGSLCPIRQRRVYFRLRNRSLGMFLCVPEPSEDMKAARVLVSEPRDGSSELWYYDEGRIKNQLAPQMSLQVIGQSCPGTKVVLWSDGRKPVQTWVLKDSGYIMNDMFHGLCLDVKGGQSFDSDHVVVWEVTEERLTQRWDLEVF